MTKILFEQLHPDELKQIIKESGTVFLPLGSLEWHERHLPFGLDTYVAYEICKRVCKRTGGCVIPPVYFGTDREFKIDGKTFHGMDARAKKILPGSIYFLKQDLFYQFLKSIAKNVGEQGFRKLVIVSQHCGTLQRELLLKFAKEKFGKLKVFVFPSRDFPGGMDHAGKIETSLMMGIDKSLVHMDKLNKPYVATNGNDPKDGSEKYGKSGLNEIVEYIEKRIR